MSLVQISRPVGTPPPAGGGLLTGWFADWASQTADLAYENSAANTSRIRDRMPPITGTDRWNSHSHNEDARVISAPSGHNCPFAKMVENVFQTGGGGGAFALLKSNLATPAVGATRDHRWYEMFDMPNANGPNDGHGVGDDQGDSGMNWSQNRSYRHSDNTRWRDAIWFLAGPGSDCSGTSCDIYFGQTWATGEGASQGSNNFANDYQFLKDHLYMNCVKIKRVSTTTFWLKRWIYDAETTPATLLFSPSTIFNRNASKNLGQEVEKTIRVLGNFGHFVIGQNGIIGGTYPLPFSRWGGVAAVDSTGEFPLDDDTPIGEYGTVTNGVQTETPV